MHVFDRGQVSPKFAVSVTACHLFWGTGQVLTEQAYTEQTLTWVLMAAEAVNL
ncbi:hypothetical protein [Shewanella halotolerans]|uniref:hypothetical protein n=1 Tax=Shewanella halotolerans TaxID=2864204 RepID=UPI001C65FBFE|nr:hypothetical protein [Shewanella halotolerans]QYJ89577.1 hypothetical protein K0H81_17685 [Shewanella halotolerans]